MGNYSRKIADKSIPSYKAIVTLFNLANNGTISVVTAQSPTKFDLQDSSVADYHEGLAKIEVLTTNGQGATPTSPGAAESFTIFYAFSDEDLTAADAPTILQNVDASLVCTLPDSSASTAAGIRVHATGPFVVSGRYLYVWYDRTDFAANALVDLTAKLIRC